MARTDFARRSGQRNVDVLLRLLSGSQLGLGIRESGFKVALGLVLQAADLGF